MRKNLLTLFLPLLAFTFSLSTTTAQEDTSCVTLVRAAISQVSTQCAISDVGSACYGHDDVLGSFLEESSPGEFTRLDEQDFFLEPGDKVSLNLTEAIQTGPLNRMVSPSTWGLSVLNIQADLPTEIVEANNGMGTLIMLLGGVEIENDVMPTEALQLLPEGIRVTTMGAIDMRKSPVVHETSRVTNVMARVPGSTTVNADAITPDGEWVRIVYDGKPGWINRDGLPLDVDLSPLVEMGPEDFTPMQSFYFRNGIRNGVQSPGCALAPSLVFVQGPRETPVHLRVHNVDIRLESSMILRSIQPGDQLGQFFEIIPLYGVVTVFPDTDDEIFVPPGFVLRIALGELVSLGIEGDIDERALVSVVSLIRPLTPDEIELLDVIAFLPSNLLHYLPPLPRWVTPSAVGEVIDYLAFNDQNALGAAQTLCNQGVLPVDVCEALDLA